MYLLITNERKKAGVYEIFKADKIENAITRWLEIDDMDFLKVIVKVDGYDFRPNGRLKWIEVSEETIWERAYHMEKKK